MYGKDFEFRVELKIYLHILHEAWKLQYVVIKSSIINPVLVLLLLFTAETREWSGALARQIRKWVSGIARRYGADISTYLTFVIAKSKYQGDAYWRASSGSSA